MSSVDASDPAFAAARESVCVCACRRCDTAYVSRISGENALRPQKAGGEGADDDSSALVAQFGADTNKVRACRAVVSCN
jgi:hypothetical protein